MFWCTVSESITYSDSCMVDVFNETDIMVEYDAVITPMGSNSILMNDTVYLYNSGHINANIDTNGKNLFVYNSGTIDGIINSDGGNVIQVIRSDKEIKDINMVDNQSPDVVIENYDNFNFDNIDNINATSFTIKDSSVVIDDFNDWQMCSENINLRGNVSLIINHVDTVNPGEVINYTVSGDTISVQITDLDKMYKPELVVANGGIVLNIVRETNYDTIFGDSDLIENKRNSSLEQIRNKHPNDRLLMALDGASDMNEINRLKSLSYRFNHDILLRPVKMMNNVLWANALKNDVNSGVGFVPYYIYSDKMNSVGGRVYVGDEYDNLYFNVGVNINNVHYVDYVNDFSGMYYGLDMKTKQTFNRFWLGEIVGVSLTDLKAEYISAKGELKNNPKALSLYGDVASGYDFNVGKDVVLSPIVGASYQFYKVADVNDTDVFVHGGADVKYTFVVDSIKYEYSLYGGIASNGDVFANIKIGFLSISDNAGVSLDAGIFKDDFDYYYRYGLNAKVVF